MIHVLNQYRADPESRLQDYLQRCYENWRAENEDQRLKALGYRDGVTVIRLDKE